MSDKTLAQRLEAHAQMHAELAASTGDTEQRGYAADLREAIALLAERDALRADAERYRLVRRGQHWSVVNGVGDHLRAEELDSAVDAARGAA